MKKTDCFNTAAKNKGHVLLAALLLFVNTVHYTQAQGFNYYAINTKINIVRLSPGYLFIWNYDEKIERTTYYQFGLADSLYFQMKKKYGPVKQSINDCVLFKPFERFIENESLESPVYERPVLPFSVRFTLDSNDVSVIPEQTAIALTNGYNAPVGKVLTPFYFRKYEVTNGEYREFVNYVKDSIARTMLFRGGMKEYGSMISVNEGSGKKTETLILNRKTSIDWRSDLLSEMYIPPEERFNGRKEIDTKKLNYQFNPEGAGTITINVYPDTMCWVSDFSYSFNDSQSHIYFWHKNYNDYPVVGITWYQALAYLDWRSRKHQKELDARGIKLAVKYDLPSEIEWDIAATTILKDGKPDYFSGESYSYLYDRSWLTDLSLVMDTGNVLKMVRKDVPSDRDAYINNIYYHDTTTTVQPVAKDSLNKSIFSSIYVKVKTHEPITYFRGDELKSLIKTYFNYPRYFSIDGSGYTVQSNINKLDKKASQNELVRINRDERGICFMGGNVSEWMKESYSKWKPVFDKRQQQLATFEGEDVKILSQIEKYFDTKNDPNGKLVRGSNWYDERFSNVLGRNPEGANAKAFVDPNKSHSTLGFRYVIHFEPK